MNIENKTVFITGGADGIGLATAKKLLAEGANVVIYSKNTANILNQNLDQNKVLIIEGDVRDREQVKNAMKAALDKFGKLNVLINNAGVAKREDFMQTDDKDWNFVLDVNVKGVFICTQEAAKAMENNTEDKMIINIASGAGIHGVDEIAVYSASKAAVINLAQSLNEELKNKGIKLFSVAPGATETKMFDSLFPEEEPYHTPEQIAEVIYKSLIGEIKPDERLIIDVFHHITKI